MMTRHILGRAGRSTVDRPWRPWVSLATSVAIGACGNLTVGGAGEVEVSVSGDAEPPAQLTAEARLGTYARDEPRQTDDEPEGDVEAEFDLFLVDAAGRLVPLTEERARVRVDVRGRNEAEVVRATVPTGPYMALQIVFTDIKAEVESGLVIDGVEVVGDVRVELDDGSVSVSRPVDFVVRDASTVRLLVDLNTTLWLRATDPNLRLVAEAIFRDAVEVRSR